MKYTVTVNTKGIFEISDMAKIPNAKGTTLAKATKLLKELQDADY